VFRGESSPVPIHFIRTTPEDTLFDGRKFSVSAFPVTHRGRECFGYIFKEHDRRPFEAEKANALGVPVGPERGRLVAGESVTLADGTVVHPDDVLGETIQGTKVVITGDIARTDNIREYVQDADALVIEATYLDVDKDMARQVGHITARQAAELATECNVKYLFLTHVSRRYREYDVIKEARKYFENVYVVRDLDHFAVFRDKLPQKMELTPTDTDDLPEWGG
jgi:ribonuclease Z